MCRSCSLNLWILCRYAWLSFVAYKYKYLLFHFIFANFCSLIWLKACTSCAVGIISIFFSCIACLTAFTSRRIPLLYEYKCNAVLDMSNSLQLPSCQVVRIQEQEHKKWCMFIRYACSLLYSFSISMNFRCFVIFGIIAWYASWGFTFLRQGELLYLLRQIALCWL